jgi:FkbM family methyltransferase
MSEAETPSPSEMARALKELARFRRRVRAARELGIPMPFRRWRRKSLEARLRGLWRGAYVQTDGGDLAYLPPPLEFQAMRILFGGFEAHPAAVGFLPEGGIAIDIGANLGEWTVPLARKAGAAGKVLAIEPNPVIAEALGRTLVINNLTQATVLDVAVSDRAGSAELMLNPASSGESRLGQPTSGQPSVTVPTRRLDDLMAERGLERLDLVKIDVEGHERQVLEGAKATLGRFQPALVIESGHERGDDRTAIADLLERLGYALVAVLHDQGALPATVPDYRAARGACAGTEAHNLLLLPKHGR